MIRSAEFDDIYFSPDDGLAETAHVFLRGNNLPESWENHRNFVIAETGFGTGLNFLSAWKLWEDTAASRTDPGAVLDFISFEKFPLSPAQIAESLAPWADYFGGRLRRLVESYPLRVNGFHRVHLSSTVRLTLVFDDVNDALPQLSVPGGVHAWFLDGFAPAKNPQMWSDVLFTQMARLSAPGARVASFTAAGLVRRGLASAGFAVTKVRGYGRKRDMTTGIFTAPSAAQTAPAPPARVAVLGAGLAGTSCAMALRRRGVDVVLHDDYGVAAMASGNPVGLYNPRFSQYRSAESDFFASGYAALAALTPASQRVGSLHLLGDDERQKRLGGFAQHGGWHSDHVALLGAADASALAGIALTQDCLWLPDSGYVSPRDLCLQYAQGIRVAPSAFDPRDYNAVILANGVAARQYPGLSDLPLQSVRGQISLLQTSDDVSDDFHVRTNLCYGGYLSARQPGGGYVAGATFQQWRDDVTVCDEDHAAILSQLEQAIPATQGRFFVTGGRAALRCAARDRFPVIGAVPDSSSLYISTAHGSHGLISSLAGAEYLADLICGTVTSLSAATAGALAPGRFAAREAARARKRDGQKAKFQ